MMITMQMINPVSIKQQFTTLNALHFIALVEQKFGGVSPVLPGDTGN